MTQTPACSRKGRRSPIKIGGEAAAPGLAAPETKQGQVGRGLERQGIMESVPACGRGWDWIRLKISPSPNYSGLLYNPRA